MNKNLTESTALQLKDWLVSQLNHSGRINQTEFEILLRILLNRYYDQK